MFPVILSGIIGLVVGIYGGDHNWSLTKTLFVALGFSVFMNFCILLTGGFP